MGRGEVRKEGGEREAKKKVREDGEDCGDVRERGRKEEEKKGKR